MLRMLGYRFVLLAGLFGFCTVQCGFSAEGSPGHIVSPQLLDHAKLRILWENELPIKKTETLQQLLMLGNRIYAVSNRNYLASLNRENGNEVFARIVPQAGLTYAGLKLHGDVLLSAGGSKLVEIDAQSGAERKTTDVGFGITCPAARNSSYFYVAGVDNRLHVIRADDRVQTFEVAAENDSIITSVLADETSVVFTTAAGNVLCVASDGPRLLWQFDASGAIAGPLVRDSMSLFFASKDTNVYRVDITGLPERRRLVWKHQTAAVLEKAPSVTQKVVYQHVRGKGLTAIDKENGSFLWLVPGGVDLLAEYADRAYVITETRTLVVMDNAKARKLYSVNFAGVSKHVANTADEKIYIADNRGRIACLQPVQ